MKGFARRRGSILLLVLIIIPVLSLGAYSFTHWMRSEARGAMTHLQTTQSLWLAHSGVEQAQALLSDANTIEPGAVDLEDNPSLFSRILVAPEFRSMQGMFSLIGPPREVDSSNIRYGLTNESAKIPLHRKSLLFSGKEDDQRLRLSGLPNMTPELADAILDWIDKDDTPRVSGAEADYYLSLANPYSPRNAAPRTLGELLLVRGVTPWLLFGEDANLDGVMNPNENDGERTWPPDNQDGKLDTGWFPYLTIYSAASNLNPDGSQKIDLNGDLNSNKEKLVEKFGQEWFEFVTKYKENKKGKKIRAVSELIDAKVEVPNDENSPNGPPGTPGNRPGGKKTIESPWKSAGTSQYLDDALANLAVSTPGSRPERVRGLIDVTRAPFAVLRTLPSLTEQNAEAIAGAARGRALGDKSPAWLLTDGLITLSQFRQIETLVTSQSRVYRVESVGFFSQPGPVARVEAVIDATQSPARVLYRRELLSVGNAYPYEMLAGGTTSALPSSAVAP
ncbi:general secretion pathway protein GspK [bacterium]|nr:general secretion pathway protein GspK [bacterium]